MVLWSGKHPVTKKVPANPSDRKTIAAAHDRVRSEFRIQTSALTALDAVASVCASKSVDDTPSMSALRAGPMNIGLLRGR
jgi:hypothetical protein